MQTDRAPSAGERRGEERRRGVVTDGKCHTPRVSFLIAPGVDPLRLAPWYPHLNCPGLSPAPAASLGRGQARGTAGRQLGNICRPGGELPVWLRPGGFLAP
ncbi:hypothetical protein COCON_G00056620 [Conger conger]|uniref:Uncharacterized protein n=1 Tax=Conger conger TaxID=82655 RepID=A0A9Q1DQL8_CONCO|nr:hypothetical protein COCON_G00056620 [Conger conger]